MSWKEESGENTFADEPAAIWERLVYKALGYPDKVTLLPYSHWDYESRETSIYKGMESKISGIDAERVAVLSTWDSDNHQLVMSLYRPEDSSKTITTILQFSVTPQTSGGSKVHLNVRRKKSIGKNPLLWFFVILDKIEDLITGNDYNFAEGILADIHARLNSKA